MKNSQMSNSQMENLYKTFVTVSPNHKSGKWVKERILETVKKNMSRVDSVCHVQIIISERLCKFSNKKELSFEIEMEQIAFDVMFG